ncbi:MAG: hypothetical protein WC895_04205 [Candidatus Shapirobacteria bacterium]|jgi:hypothetical protein
MVELDERQRDRASDIAQLTSAIIITDGKTGIVGSVEPPMEYMLIFSSREAAENFAAGQYEGMVIVEKPLPAFFAEASQMGYRKMLWDHPGGNQRTSDCVVMDLSRHAVC